MAMDAEQYVYARSHIRSARRRFDRIYEELEEIDEEDPHGIIQYGRYFAFRDIALVDCQICIEVATKALFPLLGMNYPQTHAIDFKDAEDLIRRARYADDFDFEGKTKIPRAVFLTQLWSMFYTLAKYGQQDYHLPTGELFDNTDAEYALKHAEFCVELAEDLLEYQEGRYEDEYGEDPSAVWRDSR